MTVIKANVYNEVAKTTSYTGAKMKGDDDAYDRIFTTDDDRTMLERFWTETCDAVTSQLKPFILSVSDHPESHGIELARNYEVELELSSSFDMNLKGSIESSLFSFFVMGIISKWYKFNNKEDIERYASDAAGMLDDVMRKIYYKKKPRRVEPQE